MPASIGVNLRVTGHCRQGGRKYMEDFFSVAYQQTEDERDLEYAFFGIYDGHGGAEAAAFAKERLMETIVRHKYFWSDNDEDVLRAIKLGYIATHYAMWKEQDKWPKTASGLPSTAGTTASIAFIRRGKIYIGHVGDSAIVLGYQEPGCNAWKAKPLTRDHKPESAVEMTRIEQCGGKVVAKSGVPRVVWNRPRIGHKGPVRRSTPIDEIPFLAVARSLGDLWSYNSELDEFVVSPDPDCSVIPIDTSSFRCLIFGTDGLYNMLSPPMAVHIVQQVEKHNEDAALSDAPNKIWLNPSKCLVERALKLWTTTKMRADNTSVVTLMLDPPGPPRAQVLRNRKKSYPDSGLQIMTRYQNEPQDQRKEHPETSERSPVSIPEHNPQILKPITSYRINTPSDNKIDDDVPNFNMDHNKSFILKPRESLGFDPNGSTSSLFGSEKPKTNETETKVSKIEKITHNLRSSETKSSNIVENAEPKEERCLNCKKSTDEVSTSSCNISSSDSSRLDNSEENIQINEISSSSSEMEDEETVGDQNLSKANFRNLKVRNSTRRLAKKPNQPAKKPEQGRKRCLSEPSESNDVKKTKRPVDKTPVEETRRILRIRKIGTSKKREDVPDTKHGEETVAKIATKRNEEMVNQVDSTNKDPKIKPKRKPRTSVEAQLIKTCQSCILPSTAARHIRLTPPIDDTQNNRLNRKLKMKNKLARKLSKTEIATSIGKKLRLLKKKKKQTSAQKQLIATGPNKQKKEAVNSSNNTPPRISRRGRPPNQGNKSKRTKPSKKEKGSRMRRGNSFKIGHLRKLRRQVSTRNQKK